MSGTTLSPIEAPTMGAPESHMQNLSVAGSRSDIRITLAKVPELVRRASNTPLRKGMRKQERLAEPKRGEVRTIQELVALCTAFVKERGEKAADRRRPGIVKEELMGFYSNLLLFGVNYQRVTFVNRPRYEEVTVDFEHCGSQFQLHAFRNWNGESAPLRSWRISIESFGRDEERKGQQ